MAIGDIANPKRLRIIANERFDNVDAEYLSQTAREHQDALNRGVVSTPLAAGIAAPVGLLLQGGAVTRNPTGGADGLLRVDTDLLVAYDSDGRLLIKPAGVTYSVAITGTVQVYLYHTEAASDANQRRFISAASPYTESVATIATKYESAVGVYVRTGFKGGLVASDTVLGETRALFFLGMAHNPGTGAVWFDGWKDNERQLQTLLRLVTLLEQHRPDHLLLIGYRLSPHRRCPRQTLRTVLSETCIRTATLHCTPEHVPSSRVQ